MRIIRHVYADVRSTGGGRERLMLLQLSCCCCDGDGQAGDQQEDWIDGRHWMFVVVTMMIVRVVMLLLQRPPPGAPATTSAQPGSHLCIMYIRREMDVGLSLVVGKHVGKQEEPSEEQNGQRVKAPAYCNRFQFASRSVPEPIAILKPRCSRVFRV